LVSVSLALLSCWFDTFWLEPLIFESLPLGSISYKLDSFVFSVIAISLLSLAAAALSFSVSKDVLSPEAVSYLEEDSVIECSVAIPAISSFSVVSLTEIFSS